MAASRNQLRLGPYQRLDWRINKSWTKAKYKITLYGEVVNLTDRAIPIEPKPSRTKNTIE